MPPSIWMSFLQAVAGAKAIGRNGLIVTTNDLGPDTAIYVARGEILAIGAQLPYDLGVAEANAAAFALLGKKVPPYISLPAVPVRKANLITALELVTKRPVPEEIRMICAVVVEDHFRCEAAVGAGVAVELFSNPLSKPASWNLRRGKIWLSQAIRVQPLRRVN